MSKYINADQFERDCMFDKNCEDMQDVIYKLRDYPAADVRENKHGEWVYQSGDYFTCTNCGDMMVRNVFPFCPWCGADMRGETE